MGTWPIFVEAAYNELTEEDAHPCPKTGIPAAVCPCDLQEPRAPSGMAPEGADLTDEEVDEAMRSVVF